MLGLEPLTMSHILLQVAANLMTDEMLMRSAQLTPEYRPLVDFHVQYSTVQSQKGWRYGYTDASRPMERNTTFHEMVWHPHKNGHIADGRWQATEARLWHSHPEDLPGGNICLMSGSAKSLVNVSQWRA